jgi:hypothetical protein
MNLALSLLTAQQNLYRPENEFRAEFIQHLMLETPARTTPLRRP